jgi:hypothetical protein
MENTGENLQAEYDTVVSYLNDYRNFVARIGRRVGKLMFSAPREYNRLNKQFWRMSWNFDPLSERNQDASRLFLSACATEEERVHAFFGVGTSDYPTDALSDHLKSQFPSFSFEKLLKLHDRKLEQLKRFSLWQILGAILAVAAWVIKSIPQTVVEGTMGISYNDFQEYVFWGMIILVAYLFLTFMIPSFKYHKAKRTHQRVGDILAYTVLKNS